MMVYHHLLAGPACQENKRLFINSFDSDVVELQAFTLSLIPSQAHTFSSANTKQHSAHESKQEKGSHVKYLQWMELNSELSTQMIRGHETQREWRRNLEVSKTRNQLQPYPRRSRERKRILRGQGRLSEAETTARVTSQE